MKNTRVVNRRRLRFGLVCATLSPFFLAGCSGDSGGSEKGGLDKSLGKLSEQTSPAIAEWASAVAVGYLAQAQSGGPLDFLSLEQKLGPKAQELSRSLCDHIEGDKTLTRDENTDDVSLAVGRLVDEAVARALAADAELLLKTGLDTAGSLPSFVLNEPAPAPDTPLDPTALANLVKPEFLGNRGGLRLPTPQDPTYRNFQQWFYEPSLDNKLLEKSMVTDTRIRTSVDSCLAQ